MALDFPNPPLTVGQTYTGPGGAIWSWDGTKWVQAGSSGFPSGTRMLFYQAAAPVGWTQVTTQNDKLLRVVSGAGGGGGGTNNFSTVNAQTVTGGHSLVAGEIPTITSSVTFGGYGFPATSTGTADLTVDGGSSYHVPQSSSGWGNLNSATGTSNNTGGGTPTAHTHTMQMNILYVDMIIASKN